MPQTATPGSEPPPSALARFRDALKSFLRRDIPTEGVSTPKPPKPPAPLQPCEKDDHHHAEILFDAWKKMVDVQQHFNDIELRIRNFAVTVFAATFGALAYALEHPSQLDLLGFTAPLTTGVMIVALTSWLAFYFMDRWWYHQLLIGSVLEAIDLENQLTPHFANINLTKRIGENSPIKYGYPTIVASAGLLLLLIARRNDVFARGLFGFALVIAFLAYRKYRYVWPRDERFNYAKRFGLNDIVMIGGVLTSLLFYKEHVPTATMILAVSMFVLTNRMARHHKNWRMRSSQKVDLFYLVGFLVLFSVGWMLHVSPPKTPPPSAATGGQTAIGGARPTTAASTTSTTIGTNTTPSASPATLATQRGTMSGDATKRSPIVPTTATSAAPQKSLASPTGKKRG